VANQAGATWTGSPPPGASGCRSAAPTRWPTFPPRSPTSPAAPSAE
jgi:hypothetical protein